VPELFFTYCRPIARGSAFLLFGRMLKTAAINIPEKVIQVKTKTGRTTQPLLSPAFYQRVWQAPDGRRAVSFSIPRKPTTRHPADGRTLTVQGAIALCAS
jgi:hypothetical protein